MKQVEQINHKTIESDLTLLYARKAVVEELIRFVEQYHRLAGVNRVTRKERKRAA
jgi:hypothetical protein